MKYIGHGALVGRLEKFLSGKNDSRSFLFCGPKHSGKGTLARALALAWVLRKKELDFSGKESGEIVRVSPQKEEKKGVLKEKGITVDALRTAMRFASLSSVSGRRAILVEGAETMTQEAQNAFLKTLEEPAAGVIIVVIAHAMDAIVPTFVSRCDRVAFGSISKEVFEKEMGVGPSERLWELSLGLPGLGKELLRNDKKREEQEELRKTWEGFLGFGTGERLRTGEVFAKNVPKAIEALHFWAFLFRKEAIFEKKNIQAALTRAEKLMECARLLKNTQVNARLILENTLLSL